jgi:hypothetical protein
LWNEFLSKSNTPILLFDRNFMEYHQNRFTDHSLLFFDNSQLIALLPANQHNNSLYSHQGLTFGGLITKSSTKFPIKEKIITSLINYCKETHFNSLLIKQLPNFLQQTLDESEAFIWKSYGGQTQLLDLNAVINFSQFSPEIDWQNRKYRNSNKAEKNHITVIESIDYQSFWKILTENLHTKFGLQPVHNLDEIKSLQSIFPKKIKLYVAMQETKILAGTVLFDYGNTIHAQYIAANEKGKQLGAIDFLFAKILTSYSSHYQYFSFGVSNTRKGYEVNQGLLEWKQGWGAMVRLHEQILIKL